MNGHSFPLVFDHNELSWRETGVSGEPICPGRFNSDWRMYCEGFGSSCGTSVGSVPGLQFTLENTPNQGGGECESVDDCSDYTEPAVSVQCNPLVIVFESIVHGSMTEGEQCDCCDPEVPGGMFVTVTE